MVLDQVEPKADWTRHPEGRRVGCRRREGGAVAVEHQPSGLAFRCLGAQSGGVVGARYRNREDLVELMPHDEMLEHEPFRRDASAGRDNLEFGRSRPSSRDGGARRWVGRSVRPDPAVPDVGPRWVAC